jgi:hypothetical protein
MALDSLFGAIEAVIELHTPKIGAADRLLQRRRLKDFSRKRP